ncbi:NAD(P)-binding protein [Rugamonas sp. FT107W]|uniref:NAD(P)-binding protein n=1 Tax=Duganella vulcania TaxID=2692166 RepID=A0A845HGU0_9BURK|nr:GMC family oxidoreductase [Duganella vulcania]MYN16805.1 NAD(P)-binding protein [Duganella vulcania]
MQPHKYDVVIVGSGIAGAVMAKTLTRAGKQVLMLEAGLGAGLAFDQDTAFTTYQQYLTQFYANPVKVPNSPYPDLPNAPSIDVVEESRQTPYDTGYLVQLGPQAFASDCLRGAGGTTLHWLGNVPRMLPRDFQLKTLYGQGVDWPISYAELMPYYDMAEFEIGVAGDVAHQVGPDMGQSNYGAGYVFPMKSIPASYQDKIWFKHTDGLEVTVDQLRYKLTCIGMPQGRNSVPNPEYRYAGVEWDATSRRLVRAPGRHYTVVGATWNPHQGNRCEGNASCMPICPVQAKYNALKTLNQAPPDKLTVIPQAVASTVDIDPSTGRVRGIHYKLYQSPGSPDHTCAVATGAIYVLAANAIENAKILLASGAANSSDQVGRNLMDHLVMLTWGLTPEKVYPYRGPGCTSYVPTFRDGAFRSEFSAWISPIDNWGWSWPTGAPGTDVSQAIGQGMFGAALRTHINETVTRQALFHFECEQPPDPDNRVTIDPRYKDNLGNYRPVIQYDVSDYVRKAFEAARDASDQIFAANGIADHTQYTPSDTNHVWYRGRGYTWYGAGHIAGTHRMGASAADSVVDRVQRSWDHDNLFVVGCGSMPTVGTSNPTLTMTAMAFMSAEAILQQLPD